MTIIDFEGISGKRMQSFNETTEKLKPCPFCGGKARLIDWQHVYEFGTIIRCQVCEAQITEGVECGDGYHERAVEKWNRRVDNG